MNHFYQLKKKRIIIVPERWNIKSMIMYNMTGYQMYHNESEITIVDGVV